MSSQPEPIEPPQEPQARIQANQRRLKDLLKLLPAYLRMGDASSVNLEKPNTASKVVYLFNMYKKRDGAQVISSCTNARGKVEDPRFQDDEGHNTCQQVIDDLNKLAQRLGGWPVAIVSHTADSTLGKGASGGEYPLTLTIDLSKPQLTEKLEWAQSEYQRDKDTDIANRVSALVTLVNREYPNPKDKADVVSKALDTIARGTGVKASITVAGTQSARKLG